MKEIRYEDVIRNAAPGLRSVCISATVRNGETQPELSRLIDEECARIADSYELQWVNKRRGIAATREAYKSLGKEPNRYRPSAEALCRRIVNGKGLYRVSTLVDLINLVSVRSGYSIGGFDEDKIEGPVLTLGRGREGEEFHAIGRGLLNIDGLPVYRDAVGGIGTPTSDEDRTKLSSETCRLLMVINIYGEEMSADDTVEYAESLLRDFAGATDFEVREFSVNDNKIS